MIKVSEEAKKAADAARHRAYRAKKKEAGICRNCPQPAEPGKTTCRTCLDEQALVNKIRRSDKKAAGICYRCSEPVEPGKAYCRTCLDAEKTRIAEKKAAGICRDCSNPIEPGKASCRSCLDAEKTRIAEKKAAGICFDCSNPTIPGKVYCVDHRLKSFAIRALGSKREVDQLQQLLEKQKYKCLFFGTNLSLAMPELSIDHNIPLSRGGQKVVENCCWTTNWFNSKVKFNSTVDELLNTCLYRYKQFLQNGEKREDLDEVSRAYVEIHEYQINNDFPAYRFFDIEIPEEAILQVN